MLENTNKVRRSLEATQERKLVGERDPHRTMSPSHRLAPLSPMPSAILHRSHWNAIIPLSSSIPKRVPHDGNPASARDWKISTIPLQISRIQRNLHVGEAIALPLSTVPIDAIFKIISCGIIWRLLMIFYWVIFHTILKT